MELLKKISRFSGNYFAFLVVAGGITGLLIPDATVWVIPHIPLLLGIIMFGMGMTLHTEDFEILLKNPKHVIIGVIAQYTIMPAMAFLLCTFFNLPPELAVGIILVGTCPGGTASNVITYLAKGDVALSVAMTSISTFLSPFLTPLLTLLLAGKMVPVSAASMFLSIVKIVLAPVILGIILNHFFKDTIRKISEMLPLLSVSVIVIIVAGIVGINGNKILGTAGTVFVVVCLHNSIGLGSGYLIGRMLSLTESSRRAISIEVGMQNSGLAVTLALLHFNPAAAIPAAIFSVWHNITGPILATFWARKNDESDSENHCA